MTECSLFPNKWESLHNEIWMFTEFMGLGSLCLWLTYLQQEAWGVLWSNITKINAKQKTSKRGILLQLEKWAVSQGYTMWCPHFHKVELFKAYIPCLSCWHSNWLSAFHNSSSWHFIWQTHCCVFFRCTRVRDKAEGKCITYCSYFTKVHHNTNKVRQEIVRIGLLSSTAISSIAQFSDKPKFFLALSH